MCTCSTRSGLCTQKFLSPGTLTPTNRRFIVVVIARILLGLFNSILKCSCTVPVKGGGQWWNSSEIWLFLWIRCYGVSGAMLRHCVLRRTVVWRAMLRHSVVCGVPCGMAMQSVRLTGLSTRKARAYRDADRVCNQVQNHTKSQRVGLEVSWWATGYYYLSKRKKVK